MKQSCLVLLGAAIGGAVGYFAFFWIARQGFYGLILPGGLLGLGAGVFKGRSKIVAILCGVLALGLGLFTEWRFAPGAATGWHRHEHDYVVVPMTTGRLLLEEPGGESRHAELTVGGSYFKRAGVEHDVINDNAHEFVFVEIEVKYHNDGSQKWALTIT